MKRREDESFEDYKVRRKEANVLLKQKLKGKMVWFSKNKSWGRGHSDRKFNQGTYVKVREVENV
jgi:hypothetical protein